MSANPAAFVGPAIVEQYGAGFGAGEIAANLGVTAEYVSSTLDNESVLRAELGVLTRPELANLPPVEPLIDGTLDRRTLAVLGGYWGTGKSFIATDWACCVATGKAWQGRPVRLRGPVLYVVAEGAHGFNARIEAWENAYDRLAGALFTMPSPVNLMNRNATAPVAEYAAAIGAELVIVDTLSRCMTGADENSAKDMSTAVANMDLIRTAGTGRTVLVVHHTGKDRTTMRGSSALEGAADTVYQVETSEAGGIRLARTKRKDGPLDDVVRLRLSVPSADGSPVVNADTRTDTSGTAETVLSVFMSAFSETGAMKADLRKACNLAPSSFDRGVNELLKAGLLRRTGTGRRQFLERP